MPLKAPAKRGIVLCCLAVAFPFLGYALSLGEGRFLVTAGVLMVTFAPLASTVLFLAGFVFMAPEIYERLKLHLKGPPDA